MSGPEQDAARRLVLSYAQPRSRDGLAALLAIDDVLADVLRTTRDAMVGQMRLTWWHDALTRLDTAPPPANPVLQEAARCLLPVLRASELAVLVEGWEELLDPGDVTEDALRVYADRRGATLFTLAGRVLGAQDGIALAAAGRAWALIDLAHHASDAALGAAARRLAAGEGRAVARWPRRLRPLGALLELAGADAGRPVVALARLLLLRLTGIPLSRRDASR